MKRGPSANRHMRIWPALPTLRFPAVTGRMYDISPDGERFVLVKELSGGDGETEAPQVVLVENWFEELERLVPTN